jgi:2-phosphosulfolactate phosphatase
MSDKRIEVLFSPTEYAALHERDLSQTACVVFDILRATTTMLTALANGAAEIIPVSEIPEALAWWESDRNVLLAGERDGMRILAALAKVAGRRFLAGAPDSGTSAARLRSLPRDGIDFDFGNSPREFTREKVEGKKIVITTTNGTRALRACVDADEVHVGSFLNMSSLARELSASRCEKLLIVCAGTGDEASLEDTLAAGSLCESLPTAQLLDSAEIALATYLHHKPNLIAAVSAARNGRTLLSLPELAQDVGVCFQRDTLNITARLDKDGAIRRVASPPPLGNLEVR